MRKKYGRKKWEGVGRRKLRPISIRNLRGSRSPCFMLDKRIDWVILRVKSQRLYNVCLFLCVCVFVVS